MNFSFTEEQLMFREQVLKFAKKEIAPSAREFDLKGEFDYESFRKLGEFGILGLHFPEELGGSGADVVTTVIAAEAIGEAGVDGGLSLSYGAHTFLCADTIFRHGTDEQKKKYVPKLAKGEWIGCMGLTEPSAGSDVAALKTRAIKKGDKYVLNGSKAFITNAPIADVAVVYARTSTEGERHDGISAFIIEKGTKGFSAGEKLHKFGMRTSYTSDLIFEDCVIPAENLLGEEGNGFSMAMQTVEWDRSTIIAPIVGGCIFALKRSCEYSKQRVQFGRAVSEFQAVKHKIADIKIFLEASRPLVYRIAWCKDQGQPINHLEAAITKLFLGDWSLVPIDNAFVIHGSYGYCHEYDIEKLYRDSRLLPVAGGTSEIQKLIISKLM